MTIEALPLGGVPRSYTENPISRGARVIRKLVTRERTGRGKEKGEDLRSFYLGMYLANENYHGRLSNEVVLGKIDGLGESGIDKRQVQRTYSSFVSNRIAIEWLSIAFQISTLQEHFPELLPDEFRGKS